MSCCYLLGLQTSLIFNENIFFYLTCPFADDLHLQNIYISQAIHSITEAVRWSGGGDTAGPQMAQLNTSLRFSIGSFLHDDH